MIGFEHAKAIFLNTNEKDILKNKKNWKREEISLLIYTVDKACIIHQEDFL